MSELIKEAKKWLREAKHNGWDGVGFQHMTSVLEQLEAKDKDIERIVTDSLNATTELLKDNALLREVVDAAKKLRRNSQEFFWNEEDGTYHAVELDDIQVLDEAIAQSEGAKLEVNDE